MRMTINEYEENKFTALDDLANVSRALQQIYITLDGLLSDALWDLDDTDMNLKECRGGLIKFRDALEKERIKYDSAMYQIERAIVQLEVCELEGAGDRLIALSVLAQLRSFFNVQTELDSYTPSGEGSQRTDVSTDSE